MKKEGLKMPWANRQQKRKNKNGITARYRGVHKTKWGYVTQIGTEGKVYYLGAYPDQRTAAKVYDSTARALWGKIAHQNLQRRKLK